MSVGERARPGGGEQEPSAAWLAVALAVVAVAAGFPNLSEIGVTWDEPHYFQSVERIQEWTARAAAGELGEMLSPEEIRVAWDENRYFNPHPPAYKIGMALTEAAFGGWIGELAAYRLSSLLAFGLLVGVLTAWTARLTSPTAGLAAGVSLMLMPRVFGHAHIAATDMPLTLAWFIATMALLLYARDGHRRWILLSGIALGLGLATKFTAFLLPAPLLVWILLAARSRRVAVGLVFVLVLGVLVAVLVNPAAWPDPMHYQLRLVDESLSRKSAVPISTHYAGSSYGYVLPWHHVVVMTVISLPVTILVLAAIGLKSLFRSGARRSLALLCLVQVAFWWGLLAVPDSPNHDGVRLWLPMFPFIAVMAGLGFEILADGVERIAEDVRRTALAGLAILYFAPAAIGLAGSSPHYLAYYGEAIGGPAGADKRGMEATYWFDAVTASFRDALQRELPERATVTAYPNHEYYEQLQDLGLLRTDLRFTDTLPADYLLLLARKAMFSQRWNSVYRNAQPELAVELDGVELVGLYRWGMGRPEAEESPDGGVVE